MLRNAFGPLLALVTASMAAALPFAHSGQQTLIGMGEKPSNAKIQDLLRRSDRTRPNQDPDLYALLFRYLKPDDVADLRRCRKLVDRKRYNELAADRLHPRRCRNEMWCPTCSRVQWGLHLRAVARFPRAA